MDDSNWQESIVCVPVFQIFSLSRRLFDYKLGIGGYDYAHRGSGIRVDKTLLYL